MPRRIKYLILFIVLLVPVVIYLFLELFGENRYAIPSYHQDTGEQFKIAGCIGFTLPHVIDLSSYGVVEIPNKIMVVHPVFDECLDCPPNLNELLRANQRHHDIVFLNLYSSAVTSIKGNPQDVTNHWLVRQVGFSDLVKILKCQLVVEVPQETSLDWLRANGQVVLIDRQKRIRGYYNKTKREDMDRLITEISILKQE